MASDLVSNALLNHARSANDFRGDETTEGQEAAEFLDRYLAEQAVDQLVDWQERRAGEDPQWSEHSGVAQSLLYLTVEEMAELTQAWHSRTAELARRRPLGAAATRGPGVKPVNFTLVATPLRPTASGG